MAVEIVTVSGAPVAGVQVGVCGGDYCEVKTASADGHAEFPEVPAGPTGVDAFGPGYHYAWREIEVRKDKTTEVTLAVVRAVDATPIVLATDAAPSNDGQMLTVDVDLAVLGEDGLAIPTFTAADFYVAGSDCGFAWCVMDDSGEPLAYGSYRAELDVSAFSWHEAPPAAPLAAATALLLEHSINSAAFDPSSQRVEAIHAFLDATTAPDSVALASYRGTPQAPVLSIYGEFTPDGTLFHDDLDALASTPATENPLYPALASLLSWSALQTSVVEPKRVVLMASPWSWPDDACANSSACRHEQRVAIADSARELGIPVVTIGGREPVYEIAARSGGASVVVEDPEQYAVALENLKSIVSGQLSFNRLRLVLSSQPHVFASGHTVWAWTRLRIAPDTYLGIPVVITIP